MRERKLNLEVSPNPLPINGMEYYWCVNCGHNGRFSPTCQILSQCKCTECQYDALTPYDLEEILGDEHLKFRFKEVLDVHSPVIGS